MGYDPQSRQGVPVSKLSATDLMSLEQYARERPAFRARVLQHKAQRQVAVGPNTTWCFEDRLTVQYQVQEMLRTERVFEPQGIAEELDAYNPLIPDGRNWKVTLLLEFEAAECSRSLMRTSSARTSRRLPPFTSCASSLRQRWLRACAPEPRSPSAWITRTIATR